MKWDFSNECDKNVNDNANPCLTCIHYSSLGCQAKKEKKGVGYNAYTGEWVNMMEAGIIDPAKVTCSALMNAASIAATMLTTECAITDIPEPKAPAAPAPDMGGMY